MYTAVDVGGTKTLIAVFDDDGKLQEQIKFPTPDNYDRFIRELADNVEKLSTKDFRAVGFAIPAKVDRKNGVGLAFGNLSWENIPVQADAEKLFHAPAVIENDANLAGLSEAIELKDKYSKVLYVTVSTGIGGGYIKDRVIHPDFEDTEIGQILLEHDGHLKRWEDFASGKAIVAKFGKPASKIDDPQVWYIIARNIAIGLIDLVATMTPDVIVIGGGVGNHFDKFKDRLLEDLKIYENPMLSIPPIIKAVRAEEAVIYGCYHLARQKYGPNT